MTFAGLRMFRCATCCFECLIGEDLFDEDLEQWTTDGTVSVADSKLSMTAAASAAGRMMVNWLPSPGLLSTVSRPPMAEMMLLASKAPTPKPPFLVEAKGWNRRVRTNSASMPIPQSEMAMVTWPLPPPIRTPTG